MSIQHSLFIDAYIGCLLWAGTDDNGEPLDTHYNIYNLSAESRSRIVRDCHYFMLVASTSDIDLSGLEAQAGHDFWLTRNGHGTGFWDRPEIYGEENARILRLCPIVSEIVIQSSLMMNILNLYRFCLGELWNLCLLFVMVNGSLAPILLTGSAFLRRLII